MAKEKPCPYYGTVIYAESEQQQAASSYVVYLCRNGNCNQQEKVFESR